MSLKPGWNAETHRTQACKDAARSNGHKGGRPRGSNGESVRVILTLAPGERVTLPWRLDDNGERKGRQEWARASARRIERETPRRYSLTYGQGGITFHRIA